MGIDKSRYDDHAVGLDHVGVAGIDVGADRDDLLAVDQHVAHGKVADCRIHAQHRTALDDVAPARRACGGRGRCLLGGRRSGGIKSVAAAPTPAIPAVFRNSRRDAPLFPVGWSVG